MGLKKSYRFAIRSSSYISLISLLLLALLFWKLDIWIVVLVFPLLVFITSFFILQYRVEHFIYKRVKKIYDEVSLLESSSFHSKPVMTDMKTLTEEIERFAKNKRLEIDTLKIRESYRKEFLGNVSHELKTPLFIVQGYLLTILEGVLSDPKTATKYLKRASKGVDRLIYIVNDLDMISRLEVGDLNLQKESFDIIKLIENVFELLEIKAEKKGITLTMDTYSKDPIMVWADRERIQQVTTNLVVNSIKYGKKDGTTEISVENLIKNKIIVRVTDNGEGIEEKNISRLFERFYRVDKSGSREDGGSGLGLSIVKHIIEAHNEKIYVESSYGIGSEFSFTLDKLDFKKTPQIKS